MSRMRCAVVKSLTAIALIAGALLWSLTAAGGASAALPKGVPSVNGKLVREIPKLRERSSNTYVDDHGRYAAIVYPHAVNVEQPDGSFLPVDTTLKASGTGFSTTRTEYAPALPKTLKAGPVTVAEDGRWVSFTLQGATAAKPTVKGATATYAGAVPGVDVAYTAGGELLKEDLTLTSAQATRSFSYKLEASAGLTPRLSDAGVVELVDADGAVRFTLGAPNMVDAAGKESHAVTHQLKQKANGAWILTTTAGDAWLDKAGRKFPVRIDPGATPEADTDCTLDESVSNTSTCLQSGLKLGRNAGGQEQRPILHFDVANALPRDADVMNAALAINITAQTAPTTTPMHVEVDRVTHSWTNGVTWDRYNGTDRWGSPGGDFSATRLNDAGDTVGGTDGIGQWYFQLPQAITDWQHAKYQNFGVVLRDTDTLANQLTIDSTETTGGSHPYLTIVYSRRLGEQRGYSLESFPLNDRMTLKVNAATGNLLLRQTDLSVPGGLGPDVTIGRSYNSYQPGPDTPAYGSGWTMDTGPGMLLDNQGNWFEELYGPSGWGVQFTPTGFDGGGNLLWKTPPGIDGRLSADAVGQHVLTMNASQDKYTFEATAANVPSRLTSVEDRNGRKNVFAYVGTTRKLSTITDNQNRVTTFFYDGSNRIWKMTDPAGRNSTYTYDPTSGLLSTYTDANTGVTRYYYDANNNLNKVTTPGGRTTTITYYPVGDPDAGKVKTVRRVTNVPNTGDGPTTTFVYDAHRDSSSDAYVTDPLGHEVRYTFDTSSRVTSVLDALGNKRDTSYTPNSDVQTYTAPGTTSGSSNIFKNSYDSDNNLVGTAAPTTSTSVEAGGDAVRTSASFPAGGTVAGGTWLPASSTDEQGKVTSLGYDAAGNFKSATQQGNAAGSINLTYSTTNPGRVDSSTDGLGKVTSYGYDAKGNLTSVTPPSASMGATTISFAGHSGADQALSRPSTVTRPTGGTETYDYDNLDRLTKVTYSDGTYVQSTYDLDGNLTQVLDSATGAGTRTLGYDALNRLTSQAGPGTTSYTYRYDLSSNLTSVQDNNGTTEYGYDAANRNVSVYQPGVATPVKFALDDKGERTQITWPNSTVTEQSFNEAGMMKRTCLRPASASTACSGSTTGRLLDFTYTYRSRAGGSGQGNLVDSLQGTVTDKDNNLTRDCYDDLGRLVRVEVGTVGTPPNTCAQSTPASTATDWWTYALDNAGNVTASQRKGQTQRTFAYADGNRLCWTFVGVSANTCASPPAGATTYSYNTAGMETAVSGGRASTYNARLQLTSVTGVTAIQPFGGGQDDLLTAGGNAHRSGVLGLSQAGSDTYVRDEVGGLVSQSTSAGRRYFALDRLGSVRALVDGTGAVTSRFDYDPYGQATSTAVPGATTSRLGYASGESLGAGLYHYGQRYYDPSIMRWTQPDPLLNAGDVRQANRYAYVGGDPVNLTDPSGLLDLNPVHAVKNTVKAGKKFLAKNGEVIKRTTCAVSGGLAGAGAGIIVGGASSETGPGAVAAGAATTATVGPIWESGCNAILDAADR